MHRSHVGEEMCIREKNGERTIEEEVTIEDEIEVEKFTSGAITVDILKETVEAITEASVGRVR